MITQMEELQEDLSPKDFHSLYLEADELLKDSPKISTIHRLHRIVRKQFEISGLELEEAADAQKAAKMSSYEDRFEPFARNGKVKLVMDWENFSLPEAVRNFEGEVILKALNEADGRVTRAAKLLGMSHQSLSLILHQRHKDLQQYCVLRRPRNGSKVKAH